MPTYVYRRVNQSPDSPESFFELRQSIHDAALTIDPASGEPVERVLQAPALLGKAAAPASPAARPARGCAHSGGCGCH